MEELFINSVKVNVFLGKMLVLITGRPFSFLRMLSRGAEDPASQWLTADFE
jgi:hypothetical protein